MSAFSNIVACVKKLYLYICCFGDELVCLSHNKFLFCSDIKIKVTCYLMNQFTFENVLFFFCKKMSITSYSKLSNCLINFT